MNINLITFASALHKPSAVRASHEGVLAELEKYFTLTFAEPRDMGSLPPDDLTLLFVATGGTERQIVQRFESLPRPAVFLADGALNSLAAALEASAWLRMRGMKSEILHGEPAEIARRIHIIYNNHRAQRSIHGSRIGVIGAPAGWLVASNVDYLLARRRWGVEYVDIPADRVVEYSRALTDDEVGEEAAALASRALACREGTPDDMLRAMKVCRALQRVAREEGLSALTVSCFRLVEAAGTTACLALALLNDEGIVAACEGDLQSVFTMLVAQTLTGRPSFMGNPSMVSARANEVVLGHCTAPIGMAERFILRSHFETGRSIAVQGLLPAGDVTLVKCGGECLDEYYLAGGTLTENTSYVNLCRTQVRVRLHAPADYFLKNPLGNHHILVQGNYEDLFQEFFQMNACRRVE